MQEFGFIVKILLLNLFCTTSSAFNMEDRIPIIKQGPKRSLFGLSVEEHYISKNPSSLRDVTFLVGAPKAAASRQSFDLHNPGALFKCSVSSQRQCKRVEVPVGLQTFEVNISNSWLGVTVKSQKPGGMVAVCAHRHTVRGGSVTNVIFEAEVGRCYVLDNNLESVDFQSIYQPCLGKVDANGIYTQKTYGYCQAGTSFAFANNEDEEITIGMPGSMLWSGAIYTLELSNVEFFPDSLFSSDEKLINHYSYVGYSVAAGFNDPSKKSEEPLFVAGAPRGGSTGQVVIFEKVTIENDRKHNITTILNGEVLGSAFGYDVEIVDVTGDNRSDLVVGAPHYYDRVNDIGGAVYVYVNRGMYKPKLGPSADTVLYGNPDSAFGTSITNLGDLNMDGFNDIAIGAPGADQGTGRVYIYHGSSSGIQNKPAQILYGRSLYATDNFAVGGFGYSLSGGLDMDLNGYPDLVVGSLSDAAFLYRSRPIVNIIGNIAATVEKININLDAQHNQNIVKVNVSKQQEKPKLAFNVTICLKYTSIPAFDEPVDISYTVKLDINNLDSSIKPRVSFSPLKTVAIKTDTLKLSRQTENVMTCEDHLVYLDNEMQDKLSPFVFSLAYDVLNKNITNDVDLPSLSQHPIVNKNLQNLVFTQVNISKNCGEDEVCESDLQMNVQYMVLLNGKSDFEPLTTIKDVPILFAGTEKEIGIKADIYNAREDAHQAILNIVYPDYLIYVRADVNGSRSVHCSSSVQNNSLIVCELGNPFRQGSSNVSLLIRFQNDERLYAINQFSISLGLSTSSVQPQLGFYSFAVNVKVQAKLTINGYATVDQIPFSGEVIGESAVKTPQDVGLYVNHEYEIKNAGNSNVGPVIVSVNWPYAIGNGKWLFYLLEYDVTGGSFKNDAVCDISSNQLDPLKINEKHAESQSSSRSKRQIDQSTEEEESVNEPASVREPKNLNVELSCPDTARCVKILCRLGIMPRKEILYLNIAGVVWNGTLVEEYNGTVKVRVFSEAKVYVNRTNILYAKSSVLSDTIVTSLLSEEVTVEKYYLEWWVVALATAAGVVLLVIIVLVMWKCGFFKRKTKVGDFHKAQQHRQASKKADEVSDQLIY